MKRIAKIVIIDPNDNHLLMYRSNHPYFGADPDLSGGTIEEDETIVDGLLREVSEEAGIELAESDLEEVYSGDEYSDSDSTYSLYVSRLSNRPDVAISWEHSSYEWLDRDEFLKRVKSAKDTYMHMVHDVVSELPAEDKESYWFKRRTFGYGWTPITWQGWVSILAFLAVVIGGLAILRDVPENEFTIEVAIYLAIVLLACLGLLYVSFKKGPRPELRWGNETEEDNSNKFDKDKNRVTVER